MHRQLIIPSQLLLEGRLLTEAGRGRGPGAYAFFDVVRGQPLDLYVARITGRGASLATAAVEGNRDLTDVRVPQHALQTAGPVSVGQVLLVGPLRWEGTVPVASAAWRLRFNDRPVPPPRRVLGTLTEYHPERGFGRLVAADGRSLFAHTTDFAPREVPQAGARYSFEPQHGPRGLVAKRIEKV